MIGGTQGLLLEKSVPGELGGTKREKEKKDLKKRALVWFAQIQVHRS